MTDRTPWAMISARQQAHLYQADSNQARLREASLRTAVTSAVNEAMFELEKPRLSRKKLQLILNDLLIQIR